MQLIQQPTDRLGTPVVLLRAVLLAAVILACAAFSHVLADGFLPSATAMGWLLLGTTVVVRSFLRRPASRALLLALIVGGQSILHLFLSVLAGHGVSRVAGATPAPPVATGGSLSDQYAARQDALLAANGYTALNPSDLLAHQWQHLVETSPWMVLTHTGAAVAVALWLASGERALAALLALSADRVAAAGPRLLAAIGVAAAVFHTAPLRLAAAARRTSSARESRPHLALVRRVVSHRGPPLFSAPQPLSVPR